MKIKKVTFEGTGEVRVHIELENGVQEQLFTYFSDEISFSKDELIGLTVQQARDLFHTKDVAYLQS